MTATILALIALTLFVFLSLKNTRIALGLVLIFLSSYLVRFQLRGIPFTLLEVMILILFACWLLKLLIARKRIFYSNFFVIALIFLFVGVIAVFISPDTRAALGIYKAYFIEPILLFLVFINVIKEKKDIKFILFCLALGALFISLLAIWQALGLFPGLEPYISESPKRVTSIFEFPTAVGKYLGPIIVLFLALILVKSEEKQPKPYQLYLWGVVILSLLATILSFTRGALLGAGIAFIFISFFSRYKKFIWLGLLIVFVLLLVLPWGREQVASIFSGSDTSTDVHLIMWQGTWRMLKAHPITGAGLAGFPAVYDLYRDPAHVELFPYPDNWILAVWSELGLAGLIIFGWLMTKFLRESIALIRKKVESYYYKISVGLIAVMICLLIHGIVDTPYFKNDLSAMFWVFIGLLAVSKKLGLTNDKERININEN